MQQAPASAVHRLRLDLDPRSVALVKPAFATGGAIAARALTRRRARPRRRIEAADVAEARAPL